MGLSEDQLHRLREIFDRHDEDGSGEIDVSAVSGLGSKKSPWRVQGWEE